MPTTHVPPRARRRRSALLGAALLAVAGPAAIATMPASSAASSPATTVQQLAAFNGDTAGSNPSPVVDFRGAGYFIATTAGPAASASLIPSTTDQLMRTDGSAAGTTAIKTLDPAASIATGALRQVVVSGGALWILYGAGPDTETVHPVAQVWTSDGTSAGTAPAWTAAWGDAPSSARILASSDASVALLGERGGKSVLDVIDTVHRSVQHVALDGVHVPAQAVFAPDGSLYYLATNGEQQTLWRVVNGEAVALSPLDGPTAPQNGPGSYRGVAAAAIVAENGRVWFDGTDAAHGLEPWVSDGTPSGTHLLADTVPGTGDAKARNFAVTGHATYIGGGGALLRTDGDAVTTLPVSANTPPLAVGNAIYYVAPTDGSTYLGFGMQKLWRLDDGTDEPVALAAAGGEAGSPLLALGGAVYFGSGLDLWRTYGTPETTGRLGFVNGSYAGHNTDSNFGATSFGTGGGVTYFTTTSAGNGSELWRVTPEGTVGQVADLNRTTGRGVTLAAPSIGKTAFWFAGSSDSAEGYEGADRSWAAPRLLATDGTKAGTRTLTTFPEGSGPSQVVRLGSKLVFSLNTGYSGTTNQLWTADAHGARQIKKPLSIGDAPIRQLTVVGHRLYGVAKPADGAVDEVVVYSGGHLRSVASVRREALSSGDEQGSSLGSRYLFEHSTAKGQELWQSDGTDPGTRAVPHTSSITSGPWTTHTRHGALFVKSGIRPRLWVTDGTSRGTRPLTSTPWSASKPHGTPGRIDDVVAGPKGITYFLVARDAVGAGLWRTDGTPAGTRRVIAVATGSKSGGLVRVGSHVAFLTGTGDVGLADQVLWKSDGTRRGTSAVHRFAAGDVVDVTHGTASSVGGLLYLAVAHDQDGGRLWTSDGTAAGTGPSTDAAAGGLAIPGLGNGPVTAAGSRLTLIADNIAGAGQLFGMRTASAKSRW